MSLLVALSMLVLAAVAALAIPATVVDDGDELEAEDWPEHDERP